VDHDWVVAFHVEDADLEQCPVRCWADEHTQQIVVDDVDLPRQVVIDIDRDGRIRGR
jgi:hypothetical protein